MKSQATKKRLTMEAAKLVRVDEEREQSPQLMPLHSAIFPSFVSRSVPKFTYDTYGNRIRTESVPA